MYASGITFTAVSSVSPGATTLIGANEGLSVSTSTPNFVVLGEDLGSVLHPALIDTDRQIPISNKNVLQIGINAQGLLRFKTDQVFYDDVVGTSVIRFSPPNNATLTGMAGQSFSDIEVHDIFNYTNASGSGLVSAYANRTVYNISAGGIAGIDHVDAGVWNNSGSTGDYISLLMTARSNQTGTASGNFRGLYYNPTLAALIGKNIAIENVIGDVYLNSAAGGGVVAGRTGVQNKTTPTAFLHIGASDGAVGDSPLKIDPGTLTAIAETGAIEYNGTSLFFTRTGTTRETVLTGNNGAAAPATSVGVAITNFYGTSATNFLGTPNSWISVVLPGGTFKIPLYS